MLLGTRGHHSLFCNYVGEISDAIMCQGTAGSQSETLFFLFLQSKQNIALNVVTADPQECFHSAIISHEEHGAVLKSHNTT